MATVPDISLDGWIAQRAQRCPLRPALTFEGSAYSYADLAEQIARLAGLLAAGGIKRGDRVGYLGFNHPMFLVTMFAASRLGAIFVPVNFRLTGPEVGFIVNDAGIHTLLAGEEHQGLVDNIAASLCCQRYLWVDGARGDGRDAAQGMAAATPLAHEPLATADDVALILYTSGTTGQPKGAMLSHGNLWWNNVNALLTMDYREDDVTLNSAPLFHIGGLNVTTLITLMKGGHVVLHRQFDPSAFLDDVPRYRVTTHFAVPAMLLFVSQHARFNEADLSSIRMLVVGGAPVPEALLRLYNERGIAVQQGYGMTETAPMISFLTPEWSLAKLGSAGRPPLLSEVRLIDGAGSIVAEPRGRGEVCTRGPNVMAGYWNRPEATRETIDENGWLRTGDVGYFDEDGFLYICDRVKDMVLSGGENVYPAEVENVLYAHPSIAEVAVIGTSDDVWGEAIAAIAVLRPGQSLTLEELNAFAERQLARYKLPKHLQIVGALPRGTTGKVLKYLLRAQFAQALEGATR